MSTKSTINALLTGALLLAGSLAGSVSFAQSTAEPAPLLVAVYPTKQDKKICLSIEKPDNTLTFVQFLAPSGEELYYASLPKKGTGFRQIFDMSDLKDGLYRLRIRQGDTIIVKSIQLRTTTPDPELPTRSLTMGD